MKINTAVCMYASYTFDELCRESKDYAKHDYLFNTDFRNEDLYNSWSEDMRFYWFPNSEAKIEYSLSSCQGDGVNVYGKFSVQDLRKLFEQYGLDTFSGKEWSALAFYESELGLFVSVPANFHYTYCMSDYIDFAESAISDLEYQNGFKNVRRGLLHNFEKLCKNVFRRFCRDREKEGYDFLLNISDSDFSELANINEWEFDADGILL